jgi:argininosuccinate synthase
MNRGFGSYGEMNKGWTAEDAKGFIKILSNPGKIANQTEENHD